MTKSKFFGHLGRGQNKIFTWANKHGTQFRGSNQEARTASKECFGDGVELSSWPSYEQEQVESFAVFLHVEEDGRKAWKPLGKCEAPWPLCRSDHSDDLVEEPVS